MRGIRPWAQHVLRCPVCHGELTESGSDDVQNPEGRGFACAACRRVFPVQDDIPVLLAEQSSDF